MIGIGIPLVESDLWWVLNKRSRYKKVCPEISNSIYYYGTQIDDMEVINLLKAFDVKVIQTDVLYDDWKSAYRQMFEKMKINMNQGIRSIKYVQITKWKLKKQKLI